MVSNKHLLNLLQLWLNWTSREGFAQSRVSGRAGVGSYGITEFQEIKKRYEMHV